MEWASYDPSLGRTAEVAVLDTHSVKFATQVIGNFFYIMKLHVIL